MAKATTTLTVNLTEADLKEAVALWVKHNQLVPTDADVRVDVRVATQTQGYGMAERDVHVVEATASVNAAAAPTGSKP